MKRSTKIYKKLHRWPGLIICFFLLYFSITGIIMNHRQFFSGLEVNQKILPVEFQYRNWNNAAVKGNLIINNDSILVYGNIGVLLTDSLFSEYRSFNQGFAAGADNRKVFDLHHAEDGNLYAATQFGFYSLNPVNNHWVKIPLRSEIKRIVGIENIGDTLYVLSRSHVFKGISNGPNSKFEKIELLAPNGYENKVSLFKTIWQLHSGEIFGIPGKLFVDALGIITLFLSLTGIVYFFFPGWIKRRKRRNKQIKGIVRVNRWSLKWHNFTGNWTFIFLTILFFTGIFLRPPLLIAIASLEVSPIKYSHLDQPNPWYDKLRDIIYDEERGILLLSTSEGMFYTNSSLARPARFPIQPPVSVMGINAFEPGSKGSFFIGSFSGLFLWHPAHPQIYNYVTGQVYRGSSGGRPVGDFKITGMITDPEGRKYMVDYDKGILPLYHDKPFPQMPENVLRQSKMSLWNFCLEIHTGRIFSSLIGDFYILIVPLAGLTSVIVVISGYLLYRKKFRKKNKKE